MWKEALKKIFWWFVGVVTGLVLGLDIVWARSIDMSKAGVSVWIFIAVGLFIILLQLVPAIILFSTFIGIITKRGFDVLPKQSEEHIEKKTVNVKS